jgi:hypothetical protein
VIERVTKKHQLPVRRPNHVHADIFPLENRRMGRRQLLPAGVVQGIIFFGEGRLFARIGCRQPVLAGKIQLGELHAVCFADRFRIVKSGGNSGRAFGRPSRVVRFSGGSG